MEQTDVLERFLEPQARMYEIALGELEAGEKESHWMWYIFPQLRGLGQSHMAYFYGIRDLQEARDYLAHPVLGQRLIRCCEAILPHTDRTAEDIFDVIDAMKLRSSMTLFASVSWEESVFHQVLDQFFDGVPDSCTLEYLNIDWM